jgi:hypothetical protein
MNIVKYNLFLHWKGADPEDVVVKFMTVIFSQRWGLLLAPDL